MVNGKSMLSKRSKVDTKKFVMPSEPPPPEKWQPDNSTDTCMVCKVERFSMVGSMISDNIWINVDLFNGKVRQK